jgi:L-ascorbate metabolism protein UlaG (beta-lactamase superfamily)
MHKQFGTTPTKSDLEKYSRSPEWNGKIFLNPELTTTNVTFWTLPKLLYKAFCKKEGRDPLTRLPIRPFNGAEFEREQQGMKAIWYGHSAILMRINNLNIFIDPMLGSNAAPISPFAVRRFSDNTLNIIDELPGLDLVLMSHDHYDHLDFDSISKLKNKTKQFYVALGVSRHLRGWGIEENMVTEFDWWDEKAFGDITITFTPTRHFSGRGLTDNAKSLWGGWAFKTSRENIWFSGDSGYGKHFTEIGARLGPFDFAFMENGQYNELWHQIHMYPEESVQAAIDANAKKIMPVHWGAFSLAQHSWTEPADRFVAEAEAKGIKYCLPVLGEEFSVGCETMNKWWEGLS